MSQKAMIAAVLAAAVGVGLYEAHRTSRLRDQIRRLQEQQTEQTQQLQSERDEATARLATLQRENDRLRRDTAELLRLRREVTRLQTERKIAAPASPQAPPAGSSQAQVAEAITNPPPVEVYSAISRAVVPWDHAAVTGGWTTPSGKRVFVFAVPKRVEAAGVQDAAAAQVEIQACVAEFPDEVVARLGLGPFQTDGKEAKAAGSLTSDQYAALLKAAEASGGVNWLSAPRISTLSGRQAQVQVVDIRTAPTGEKYVLGPVLDFVPTVSEDGRSVELGIIANLHYPTGPDPE